jgi:beta-lactam-binding protein with PASTA domain
VSVRSEFSETVSKDKVIRTDPSAGDGVKKHGTVTVTISKGKQRIEVPGVARLSPEDARAKLTAAGLTVSSEAPTEAFSSKVDEGKVIGTTPKAGTSVAVDRPITLIVSKGPEPVTLPNVVGQMAGPARSQLSGLGLKVTTQEQAFDGSQVPGTVVDQNPDGGQTVSKGDTVTLTVIAVPAGQVPVPNVEGQRLRQARQTLSAVGLNLQVMGIFGEPRPTAKVRNQNPQAGSYVD